MKIWLFTSWLENLSILKELKQYNVDIIIYMNQDSRPIEDKSLELQEKYVKEWIKRLKEEWAEKIIIHPIWEIKYKNDNFILPLFQNIIKQTLNYSIVWKIWLFWNDLDLELIENYLEDYKTKYVKTERQKKIKKFECCKFYKKEISVWKYNTIVLSKRNWMLRKLIKTDLRYFFDCWIDSILPTTYNIYHFENIINQKRKKIHFQFMKDWWFLKDMLWDRNNKYSIKFIWNWNTNMFLKHKKREILLK